MLSEYSICFFFAFGLSWPWQFSTGALMTDLRINVLSRLEHERLEFELLELRTRGPSLTRLRGLTWEEQADWDQ
jgi:hypothetical protein